LLLCELLSFLLKPFGEICTFSADFISKVARDALEIFYFLVDKFETLVNFLYLRLQRLGLPIVDLILSETLLHVRGITDLLQLTIVQTQSLKIFVKVFIKTVDGHPEIIELLLQVLKIRLLLHTSDRIKEFIVVLSELRYCSLELVINVMKLDRD
jgi:hypothetical protein